MKNQFLMVLPSNNSMKIYTDNTAACFTTKLPHELSLQGSWEVGLSEIHFPTSFKTVDDNSFIDVSFRSKTSTSLKVVPIPKGVYHSKDDLIDTLNSLLKSQHAMFYPNKEIKTDGGDILKFLAFTLTCNHECKFLDHHYRFPRYILSILGFDNLDSDRISVNLDKNHRVVMGVNPTGLINESIKQLYVYSDLCEPYFVGDSRSQLLRIVPLTNKYDVYGNSACVTFFRINYIPLLNKCFSTVTIDIRTNLGRQAPFYIGSSTVTLHFRRTD